jgi:GT2 family glycosyltransferase
MPRVVAAIVTYNRRALLAEALRAVLAQTVPVERVVVVDNASTDGTPELPELGDERVELLRLPENRGGAGGFAAAVEATRATGAGWIWLMDDDAEPVPDSLERLLAADDGEAVALCSKVVLAADGRIDANQRGDFRRRLIPLPDAAYVDGERPAIGFLSFVGSLVRGDVARATGLPRADFFVWGDDVEYSLRLRRHGPIRLVPESVILHKRETRAYETSRSRLLNRVLPVELSPTPLERFWMNLCGLRNYLWTKREYEGQGPLSAAGTTLQFVAKHVLYDDQPRRRVRWIVRYARAGRRGDFRNVRPAEWAAMVRDGRV